MVVPDSRRGDDRGQLVLAGSVAIAVVVVAAVVLANGTLFVDATTGDAGAQSATAAAATYHRAATADLERLVDETAGPRTLEATVSAYGDHLALAAARSSSATVAISLVDGPPGPYTFAFAFVSPDLTYRTTITIEASDS